MRRGNAIHCATRTQSFYAHYRNTKQSSEVISSLITYFCKQWTMHKHNNYNTQIISCDDAICLQTTYGSGLTERAFKVNCT